MSNDVETSAVDDERRAGAEPRASDGPPASDFPRVADGPRVPDALERFRTTPRLVMLAPDDDLVCVDDVCRPSEPRR
jgi:hypothetical protein